ncbi:DNA-directed RNA polymerase subunit omega [Rhodospirillaceae bacterium SYSU D60014]|uniref:DNA-directed RNA polymerase subunit omega n=1 Tax=Virgifigura deserti TaxID=2268457 RepID=UPI000E65FCE2
MARITVEDCRNVITNPYELVLLAAERVGALEHGAEPLVEPGRDHWTVIALREIAAARLDPERLRDDLLRRWMKSRRADGFDEPENTVEGWGIVAPGDAGEEQR